MEVATGITESLDGLYVTIVTGCPDRRTLGSAGPNMHASIATDPVELGWSYRSCHVELVRCTVNIVHCTLYSVTVHYAVYIV